MARIVCALLAALCLTACGTGQAEPGIEPPQESLLEQEPDHTEQSTQAPDEEEPMLNITVGDNELSATFADNSSAEEFRELLAQGPVTVEMEDYGGFEKVGSLGRSLSTNDRRITTEPGDVILYQGNSVTIYYDTNTWNFTLLGRIQGLSQEDLKDILGEGSVSVTFSLKDSL